MSPRPASKEMQTVLTHVAGTVDRARLPEVTELLRNPDIHAAYVRCTWWAGCYYCQDESGAWHVIYCLAEPDVSQYPEPPKGP